MNDLMTLEEVAAEYRIAPATLRYWRSRDRGEGPKSFKLGRRVVYRRADCAAWVEQQYQAADTRDAS